MNEKNSAKATVWAAQLGAGGLLLRQNLALLAVSTVIGFALIALKKKKDNPKKPSETKERDEEPSIDVRGGTAEKKFKVAEGRSEEDARPSP